MNVGHWYAVDKDCSSLGRVVVSRIRDPQHGTLEVRDGKAYPRFLQPNPRSVRNTQLEPVTDVAYVAEPNFKGLDQFAFDVIFPGGHIRRIARFVSVY